METAASSGRTMQIIKTILCVCSIMHFFKMDISARIYPKADQFIRNMKAAVLKPQPRCTDVVLTVQTTFEYPESTSSVTIGSETHFHLTLSQNSTTVSPPWSPAPILHYKPCSILLFNLSDALFRQTDNYSMDYNKWPPLNTQDPCTDRIICFS